MRFKPVVSAALKYLGIVTLMPMLGACAQNLVATGVPSSQVFSCLADENRQWTRRRFDWAGRCKATSLRDGCAYYDLRGQALGSTTGFDQRGITVRQLTFPAKSHLFAALSVREDVNDTVCWLGGAIVGRNPLSMTWSTDSGGKTRKNNFIQTESGTVNVDGVRIHNTHDIFLATTPEAGFNIRKSWITWNRDDFFEGQLHRLTIEDSLIDGTYNFLSDPDDNCVDASDKVVTIKDSLIRIQEQPGPYGGHTNKWHWQIEGGHNLLYKLDSCSWDQWPRFRLINNVFFIEGPYTTKGKLNRVKCNLALPGECGDSALRKVLECRNNIFLYSQYGKWFDKNKLPGPVPQPGGSFYNSDNPDFLLNNTDCYQRMTDDPQDVGYGDVTSLWQQKRNAWVSQHSSRITRSDKVMQIPGIDYSLLRPGSRYRFRNHRSNKCIQSNFAGRVEMAQCAPGNSDDNGQWFSTLNSADGLFSGGLLLIDSFGNYLRTQSPEVLQQAQNDNNLDLTIFSVGSDEPAFTERWYVLPIRSSEVSNPEVSNSEARVFYIESDAPRRSFLRDNAGVVELQPFYEHGEETAFPQRVDGTTNHDPSLLWVIEQG